MILAPPTDPKSLAENFASLTETERESILDDLDVASLMYDPEFWLRPAQLEAFRATQWMVALVAGRGFGKNHTLSEWVRDKARTPATRISLTGRTVADVRDTIVQGPSGIMNMHPASEMPEYFPSVRKIVWPNGSVAYTFSADAPSQLRGPAFHYAVCDELAAWRHIPDDSGATAFDHIQIGTRLGEHPQIMIATTPKRIPVIKDIVEQATTSDEVLLITGSTMDNATNLPPEYIDRLKTMYGGTALERQEIYGELLLVVEEALWQQRDIRNGYSPANTHRVVSVDPGVTTGGDATGIVTVYSSTERKLRDRTAWVVEDSTVTGAGPEVWAQEVVDTWNRHKPAVVVVESNQGGELVTQVLEQIDPSIQVATVHASKSKAARAEPVVLAYRQGNVFHETGADLDELEEEMTTWEPASKWSPNRLDAMVHGVRALLVDDKALRKYAGVQAGTKAASTILGLPKHLSQTSNREVELGSWRGKNR